MATRWVRTPHGVRAVPHGSSTAASAAAALVTITGTTLALLIVGAMLLPGTGGPEQPGIAAGGASPTAPAVVTGNGSIASPAPVASGAPELTPAAEAPAASPATAAPGPTVAPRPAASAAPSIPPVQVAYRTAAPVTQGGREVGRVTVQAVRQVKKTTAVASDQRLIVAEVRLDAELARLPYDELQFRLEDDNGSRYAPVTEAAPEPLGSGMLAPSANRSGQVAFAIPKGRKAVSVVLTDDRGSDLVVFSRAQPTG